MIGDYNMKSKEELQQCQRMAQDAHNLLKQLRNLSLNDFDEEFIEEADDILHDVYKAEERLDSIVMGFQAVIDEEH
jgi:hypothetical protein